MASAERLAPDRWNMGIFYVIEGNILMKECCINKIKSANQIAVQPWMCKTSKEVACSPDDVREEINSEGRGLSQDETWEEKTCRGICAIQQQ